MTEAIKKDSNQRVSLNSKSDTPCNETMKSLNQLTNIPTCIDSKPEDFARTHETQTIVLNVTL